MKEQTASRTNQKSRPKPSWPKILTRCLPSGNTQWRIDVLVDGNRVYESFKSEIDAVNRAWELHDDRQNAGKAGFELPMAKRVEAAECYKLLAPFPDTSLRDAVEYYISRKAQFAAAPALTAGVEQIVSELTGKRGERTVDNLRQYWHRFAADFGKRGFTELEPDEITAWLDRTASHPTTRHNYRRAIVRLFNIATDKKWCVENPAAKSRKDDTLPPEPEVFKVEELARVLEHTDEYGLLPYVVLGTFCGIRVSELTRLDWSKINLAERTVTIEARTTKTKTRRVVALNDTATAWLTPHVKKSGPVVHTVGLREQLHKLRTAAGIKRWPTNVMRHSFGSYALSAWQDVGKVSYQMGNSPQICKRHYEQIVTKSAAESFWALRPTADAAGKIVPMQRTANA
ncbi:MAG TPA: tyrosine-type recombinase/integrase [Verrucomicrobiae bacterium]|nr:tyrosine-type recombinase/integrase [Verrucomicrobiae bacterium]